MSIWVKCIDVDEDAFEIDLEVGKTTCCLNSAICSALRERFRIETSTVVISATSHELEAEDLISGSGREKKGCSDMSPYLFSIPRKAPAGTVRNQEHVSFAQEASKINILQTYLRILFCFVSAVVVFSEVKPLGATRNVLSNRQQSARSLACALLPSTGARETAFMDECFEAGKTALAWRFRELLEDWEHKPQGYEKLLSAVYIHVPCKGLELTAEAAAVQRSLVR